ncbi:hypothetical protein [Kiloniella laminariae]|uniref:hypothetical protein n=1 Tax=Kiloniella laminariae TaxID=454162 RepID=UPI0003749EB3|nr:hypothetical protein [Kiloniella laminariae]
MNKCNKCFSERVVRYELSRQDLASTGSWHLDNDVSKYHPEDIQEVEDNGVPVDLTLHVCLSCSHVRGTAANRE